MILIRQLLLLTGLGVAVQSCSENTAQASEPIVVLPKAVRMEVVWFKARGFQAIELYDKKGYRIAQTDFAIRGLKESQELPENVIKELRDKISNPEILKSMRVQKIKPSDEWIKEYGPLF